MLNTQCPRNLELRWQTEVSSSVYASPLIADINRLYKNSHQFIYLFYLLSYYLGFNDNLYAFDFSDGKLDIVVPSFVHYLEVLEGSDGDKMPGKVLFI